jgi:hypothetical protein
MDEQTRRELALIRADLQAVRLVLNEALAIALSRNTDCDRTIAEARRSVKRLIDETEASVSAVNTDKPALQFNRWFMSLVQKSTTSLFDDIELRVCYSNDDRPVH